MAYQHVDRLSVWAWGQRVGVVAPATRSAGTYVFQYDPDWAARGIEVAPLLMPVAGRRGNASFSFAPTRFNAETFLGLPPMLADSVPDRFGNSIINLALAQQGVVDVREISPLDRLAYVGSRGMGALTFEPDGSPTIQPTSVDLAELVEAARGALSGSLANERGRTHALRDLIAVGTSAGGARAKAVIAFNPATDEVRPGNVPVPDGFEQWLLKFDGISDNGMGAPLGDSTGFTRVEYAYGRMATDAGIAMADQWLLEEDGRAHFVTRRFDRPGNEGERLHMQSLCALAALDFNHIGDEGRGIPSNRYEALFETLDALGLATDEARSQAFRRMVFNVLAFNCDDHTKNISFLADQNGVWRLSPAYDVTFAFSPTSKWNSRHLMSVDGKTGMIREVDLLAVGKRFLVPNAVEQLREVAAAVRNWTVYADQSGVPHGLRDSIEGRLRAAE